MSASSAHFSDAGSPQPGLCRACWELTKPRLSFLSVLTALVGYLLAADAVGFLPALAVLIGTSGAAGGAAALNQWAERQPDARMHRTRLRPLPTGRVSPAVAAVFGVMLTLAGVAVLAFGTTALAGALAFATVFLYVAVYTPMKRLTVWNTEVGAIPGALPTLLGWAAARGSLSDPVAWVLFALLFCWQMPHFMAIAWLYREDYARAGFVMAAAKPDGGRHLVRQTLIFTAGLIVASILPVFLGAGGWIHGIVAVVTGLWIGARAVRFAQAAPADRDAPARTLFLASLAYLPLMLGAWVIDHLLPF